MEHECECILYSFSFDHACHHDCNMLWLHSGHHYHVMFHFHQVPLPLALPLPLQIAICHAMLLGQHAFAVICILKPVGLNTLFSTLHACGSGVHMLSSRVVPPFVLPTTGSSNCCCHNTSALPMLLSSLPIIFGAPKPVKSSLDQSDI